MSKSILMVCGIFVNFLVQSGVALATQTNTGKSPHSFVAWLEQMPSSEQLPDVATPSLHTFNHPVLVVGAGAAGLAVMRGLLDQGVEFEGVEAHQRVGGIWDQTHPESAAYDHLITNSSKATTHLGDPVSPDVETYLRRDQAHQYLLNFAERYRLNNKIRFQTRVETAEKTADGLWSVALKDLSSGEVSQRLYRAIVVANGKYHQSSARFPKRIWKAAQMQGIEVIHSSQYRNVEPFRNRRVLIVGSGNSASEIATEMSQVAAQTFMSVRSTPWIVPLRVFGKAADEFVQDSPGDWVPHWLEHWVFHGVQRYYVGHPTSLGFPKPDHDLLEKLPVSDRGIAQAIRSKKILLRPEIADVRDKQVHFVDHSPFGAHAPEEVDAIIFATGYDWKIPFLSPELTEPVKSGSALSFLIFHPTEPGLMFMPQTIVAQGGWPVFAAQGNLVGAYFKAEQRNPNRIQEFNRRRILPNPDFKGHVFLKADDFHVDVKIYLQRLQELQEWLLQ